MVSKNDKGFYKYINGTYYTIESSIVKPIYKISDLKKCLNPSEAMKYIIFPYTKGEKGYIPYQEQDIQERFPNTYKYLLEMRFDLDSRDKGKKSVIPWFAFGRTQGLNKYGKKLVFPTFSKQPNFFYIDNEDALFCNGYAIFENLYYSLELVKKILNSKIMQYYISKTSYAIEGEFFCYQKKYIERFSLPRLNEKEIQVLQEGSSEEIDKMLINAYSLKNI